MRVLVVDDSADVRFMLVILLEEAGMEVEEAASGIEALHRLADPEAGVDAVVLDQRMPGLTGLEVARTLVERGAHPPLVLFSAYLHPDIEADAEALGVPTVVKTDFAGLIDRLRAAAPVG
jgi:two-component system chemotaxis response regulator CheY